ncbi:MAG TPA: 1-(5-phosphoribosyl)-5-[(5-phosphoribosylamino)methylideneamino]imidazole-4-carboxamide isomerase [Cytophagaceae bacterium]|jgi:phosphoribosylformimino-5-aminoimidazole carboxamide ribotide isomerase|nr:1-(5-phosphoribosyl)-5-[(5-phosphoribosylamino)methylideneamino]imidazole-4-carboxamide isomerase [Cytophagaceae bacterium]
MEIIPAIDIIDGKCVRLTQGDYGTKKVYNEDPLEVAKAFEDAGIRRLHVVDLDGAKAKRIMNHAVLERVASGTRLVIDFGGGIQSHEDIKLAFNSGAKMVTGGSIAVKDPEIFERWLTLYGPEKIILGADVKDRMVAISGWQETSALSLDQLLTKYTALGAKYAICTDVAKDGLLQGPSLELYRWIMATYPSVQLIASGGVASMKDLTELKEAGVFGTIVGKAFYEGHISLKELASFVN